MRIRGPFVVALLAAAAGHAQATPPPMPCLSLPSHDWGYDDGELAAGFLADEATCAPDDSPDRFPVRATLSGLVQLDAGTEPTDIRRARVVATLDVLDHVRLVVGGDAAEGALFDAHARVALGGLSLAAGRMVTPFALEPQWSDGNLPFLERSATSRTLAPPQRADGVALAFTESRDVPVADDRSDTENQLHVHASVGVFRPTSAALDFPIVDDHDVIARAFVRRDRSNEHRSLDTYLSLGASAAIGRGAAVARRRYALEADARYYRYRASAELFVASLATMEGPFDGTGATLTLSATLPVDRERWWTNPLPRYPLPMPRFVSPSKTRAPNPGFELDLGADALRGTTFSFGALRTGAHAFFHDHAKLSLAYSYTRGWGTLPPHEHEAIVRLQFAF